MKNFDLSPLEKDLAGFDFNNLHAQVQVAKTNVSNAKTAADVKQQICIIWSKIKPYLPIIEAIPFAGKFVKIFADLMNTICAGE